LRKLLLAVAVIALLAVPGNALARPPIGAPVLFGSLVQCVVAGTRDPNETVIVRGETVECGVVLVYCAGFPQVCIPRNFPDDKAFGND
jgi:hypothetical protein